MTVSLIKSKLRTKLEPYLYLCFTQPRVRGNATMFVYSTFTADFIQIMNLFANKNMNKKRKLEIEKDLLNHDVRYKFITPPHSKSQVWQKFQVVQFEEKVEKFARCNDCKVLLAYSAVCGTGSLLRHSCFRGTDRTKRSRIKFSQKVRNRSLRKESQVISTDLKPPNITDDNEFYPNMYTSSLLDSLQPYDLANRKIEDPSTEDTQESLLEESPIMNKNKKSNKNAANFARESSASSSTTNNFRVASSCNNQSNPIHHGNIESRNYQKSIHEFDIFCSSLAIQLKKMPLRHALECQDQIQTIVTRKRLSLLDTNDENPCTPALSYTAQSSHDGDDPLDDAEALSEHGYL